MSWSLNIGKVFGTVVRIHLTFLLFLAWIFAASYSEGGAASAWSSLLFMLLLFLCVLLHEFGHILTARAFGVPTPYVTLLPIGGVAQLERIPEEPGQEFLIAIAGPLVNVAITILLVVVGGATLQTGAAAGLDNTHFTLIDRLAAVNLFLAVFNMIPAFPMDGGRVARAIAWRRSGDRNAATRFAADLGRILGWGIVAAGAYMAVTDTIFGSFGGIWLALVGVMITGAAKGASRQTQVSGRIHHISVADVMDRQPVAIPGDISVEQALDQYFLRYRWPWFPVVDAAHRFLGLLQREAADDVPEVSRTVSLVSEIVDHDRGLFVRDDAPLDSLLSNANLRRFGALMAVDADGRLSGVITIEQLGRALKESTTFTGP